MNSDFRKNNMINGEALHQGKIFKYKGIKLDGGISFYVRPLSIKDCSAMEDLSVCIYDSLEKGQECFIHQHDKNYYKDVLSSEESKVTYIGAFVGRHLVAMSYIKMIDNEGDLQEELPNHKLNIFSSNRKLGKVQVAAFGSDSVHPKYRGNQLNTTMVECRMELAKRLGATDWVSIIDRKNVWNMSPYFSNGFAMFASSVDPADNGQIALMHRPIKEKIKIIGSSLEKMHYERLNTIDNMLYMNRIGVGYDKGTEEIIFAKTTYYSDLKKVKSSSQKVFSMLVGRKANAAGF